MVRRARRESFALLLPAALEDEFAEDLDAEARPSRPQIDEIGLGRADFCIRSLFSWM